MSRSLSEWESYIQTLHKRSVDLELDRVAQVFARLISRPVPFGVITVAGTNGKGSCVAMLEAILDAASYKVGAYTSPHFIDYNERIRINCRDMDDTRLCQAFERVEAVRGDTTLTYFEFGTLVALDIFVEAQLDVVILEVGLGGRLDAVNILDADVALLTSVAIDHTDWLGPDRESIGREKAGIFRPHRPAICHDPQPPDSVTQYARHVGAHWYGINTEFGYRCEDQAWSWWAEDAHRHGLPFPALRGAEQMGNAAGVLMVLHCMRERFPVNQAQVREGLLVASPTGRFQTLPGWPLRVLDVAHNPEAACALSASLKRQPVQGRTLAVCAMLEDKPHQNIFKQLVDDFDAWYLASLDVPRGASGRTLAAKFQGMQPGVQVTVYDDVAAAYAAATADARDHDRIVVFGSFHTVGAIMPTVKMSSNQNAG
ncbi:MAG TPA: bifunctional tetrahydrofolate synthase/dihydrofolate synthase [Acidiferrobacteraceae bacterium]|nr:bifunctional tetrahydrofolate synthase/dihydrofolate synthase [Acidiferrobacteraceae bacterium]